MTPIYDGILIYDKRLALVTVACLITHEGKFPRSVVPDD